MKRFALPLVVFFVLIAFMAAGLTLHPREVPSPLIGKPAPAFSLPLLDAPGRALTANDLRGQVWVLNVWASWCVACRLEHEVVRDLAAARVVPIYGLNYKDKASDAANWLQRLGNPYVASLSDSDGLVGIDFGVYGVPETFVIDKQGVIRHKLAGPLTPQALRETIIPLVRKLNG
ncbi:DsbE family thiol:disulfide interchange protein [Variovorax sp. J22R133]|uniref:DsbE family thiol:disulfide interchange protein n=1 Tax=Variovorax brevis TaxID=3053503 RepID=UPI00257687A7|nr:DsbE family thiol:disulfide interchange protein [Variovorax sp. J22R133]MDM0113778.1 DsbE family thiol:disulfide interchange protein [Variovorax sp. J22R133]